MLHAATDVQQPAAYDIAALIAAIRRRLDGAEMREAVRRASAFSSVRRSPAWPRCMSPTERRVTTLLAEVALPGAIRSQQEAYGVHPALLDACFQSVVVHPDGQQAGAGGLLLPLGVRRLRAYASDPQRPLLPTPGSPRRRHGDVEADLDVLDEHGTVLMTVEGCSWAPGSPRP